MFTKLNLKAAIVVAVLSASVSSSSGLAQTSPETATVLTSPSASGNWSTNRVQKFYYSFTSAPGQLQLTLDTIGDSPGCQTSIAISPNSPIVASGYNDGTIMLQDTNTGKNIHALKSHIGGVSVLAISSNGNNLVSSTDDNNIQIWHIRTGQLIHTLKAHLFNISSVAISSDGKTLVSSSYDNTMKMWDMNNGKLLNTFCKSNIQRG